jgi:galactokinase
MSAADLFAATFGRPAHGSWSAPGRVNLIGEHTDYNNGLVLPFAIDARASVAAARNDDGVVRVTSAQRPGAPVELPLADIRPGGSGHDWSSYLFGVHWVLTQSGLELGGADLALDSQVPVGAGLSSSAAVECATGLALTALFDHRLDPAELARVAQRAENDYVGMPCGLMDQMASATCRAGNVLFFDVGAETTENIPFDTAASGLSVLVIDTRAHHSLADGEYAKRRASCEQAVAQLGLDSLRDIGFGDLSAALDRLDDDVLRRRVRHIVTENERVTAVVQRHRIPCVAPRRLRGVRRGAGSRRRRRSGGRCARRPDDRRRLRRIGDRAGSRQCRRCRYSRRPSNAQSARSAGRSSGMVTCVSGPMAAAYSTVPTPTDPPSSQPTASTVSSMTLRTSRIE